MVLVEDVTDSAGRTSSGANTSSTPHQSTQSEVMKYIMQDKISALLYFTRILTIFFTFFFIIPVLGYDLNALYQKALLASAATSALKLHQRMSGTPFQLSRVYFANLIIEDSCHYLLYALIFMNNAPVTITLMPVAGFALLHIASYSKTLLTLSGIQISFLKKAADIVCAKDKDLMRFVAINEIIMCPTILIMIFAGKCGIFVPFIYYRFICMRYQSRRNPYNRIMFYELRVMIEHYTTQPSCPRFIGQCSQHLINLVSRMAPPTTSA